MNDKQRPSPTSFGPDMPLNKKLIQTTEHQTKDGALVEFQLSKAEPSFPSMYDIYVIEPYMCGVKVGYLKVDFVSSNDTPSIIQYAQSVGICGIVRAHNIYEKTGDALPFIKATAMHLLPWKKGSRWIEEVKQGIGGNEKVSFLIDRIHEEYYSEYEDYLEYTVDKPKVHGSKVKSAHQRRGIATLMYLEMVDYLQSLGFVGLREGGIQSDDAKNLWSYFEETHVVNTAVFDGGSNEVVRRILIGPNKNHEKNSIQKEQVVGV